MKLEDAVEAMSPERSDLVTGIQVLGWILLEDDIHSTAHTVTSHLVWDDPFVYLNTLDHIQGDIIERDGFRELPDGLLVNVDSDTLAFKPSYRKP